MDALSVHHSNQNVTTVSQVNASDFSTFSLRCKLQKLKQNISFLEFLHALALGFGQFHTILQGGFGNQIYSCGKNFAM